VKSEPLYTTDQGYSDGTVNVAELYDGAFLQMIGDGVGTINWSGESGSIEWTNFPSSRPDGVLSPRYLRHDPPE
jgi:hypothetical protein